MKLFRIAANEKVEKKLEELERFNGIELKLYEN
jgi:hypothetical protein